MTAPPVVDAVRALLLLGALAATGCGDSYLVFRVHGDGLSIPQDVDGLQLIVESEAQEVLADIHEPLGAGQSFPISISFEPSEQTPQVLVVSAVGLLDEVAEYHAATRVEGWERGNTTFADLPSLAP